MLIFQNELDDINLSMNSRRRKLFFQTEDDLLSPVQYVAFLAHIIYIIRANVKRENCSVLYVNRLRKYSQGVGVWDILRLKGVGKDKPGF